MVWVTIYKKERRGRKWPKPESLDQNGEFFTSWISSSEPPQRFFFIRKELGDDSAINAPFNYIRLVLAAVELISTQPLYRPLIERNNILDWSYSDPSHDSSSSIIWPPSPEKRGFSIQRKRPQNSLVVYYLFMCLFLGLIFECVSV